MRAYDLLTARRPSRRSTWTREDPRLRARYGLHPHGQAVLQARRLVEAGVPLVTVFWQNDGMTNVSVYWDTHNRNFIDLKTRLMPASDQAFTALLDDLDARGLLDETLVIWTGEFGRTPRVGQAVVGGAGRGATAATTGRTASPPSWPARASAAAPSTAPPTAGPPTRRVDPVTPADVAATVYHLLGVDPALELADSLGRPLRLCSGTPIHGVLGRA